MGAQLTSPSKRLSASFAGRLVKVVETVCAVPGSRIPTEYGLPVRLSFISRVPDSGAAVPPAFPLDFAACVVLMLRSP